MRCAEREVGESVERGDMVLPGSLGDEGNKQTKFRVDGRAWHRTGDAGYLDARGRLWLVGRCAARIADEHGTVYPLQVEAAAHARVDLARCALVRHGGGRVLIVEARGELPPSARNQLLKDVAGAQRRGVVPGEGMPVYRRQN